jgi:hypothetical protein
MAGCGQSIEEKAVERQSHRAPPGWVRLVNLGSTPMGLKEKDRPLVADAPAGGFTNYAPIGSGAHTLTVTGGTPSEAKVDIKSEMATTLVADGTGMKVMPGIEVRTPGETNLALLVDGPLPSGSYSLEGGAKVDLGSEAKAFHVAEGKYKLSGPGLAAPIDVEIKPSESYSILLVSKGANVDARFLPNSPQERPAAGGMAKS